MVKNKYNEGRIKNGEGRGAAGGERMGGKKGRAEGREGGYLYF
jgi:hypothetical protein